MDTVLARDLRARGSGWPPWVRRFTLYQGDPAPARVRRGRTPVALASEAEDRPGLGEPTECAAATAAAATAAAAAAARGAVQAEEPSEVGDHGVCFYMRVLCVGRGS